MPQEKNKTIPSVKNTKGKIGWLLLWIIGVPVPILLVLYILRGCT